MMIIPAITPLFPRTGEVEVSAFLLIRICFSIWRENGLGMKFYHTFPQFRTSSPKNALHDPSVPNADFRDSGSGMSPILSWKTPASACKPGITPGLFFPSPEL
jgi:hypothetical protein